MEKFRRSGPVSLFLDQSKTNRRLEIRKDWLTCAEQVQRSLEPIDVTLKLSQLTESEQLEITAARTIQHIFTTIGRALVRIGEE
jgi:hypothetical protein